MEAQHSTPSRDRVLYRMVDFEAFVPQILGNVTKFAPHKARNLISPGTKACTRPGRKDIGILLPNNQRQHRTVQIQKDVLPYVLRYLLCPVSAAARAQMLILDQISSGWASCVLNQGLLSTT